MAYTTSSHNAAMLLLCGLAACSAPEAQVGAEAPTASDDLSAQALTATLCTGTNYTGTCSTVSMGAFNIAEMLANGIPNDSVESIQLGPNTAVWASRDANFNGPAWTLTSSIHDLSTLGATKSISSFVVGPDPNAYFTIKYPHGSLCLDVNGNNAADGTNIQVWTCNEQPSQAFRFAPLGEGVFNIVTQGAQKCVDVTGNSAANLANIQQYHCDATDPAEKFSFSNATPAGSFSLIAATHGKCVDVFSSGTTPGTNVDQYTCSQGVSQTWTLTPTATAAPLPTIALQDGNTIDIEHSQLSHPHQYDYAPSVIYDGDIYRMWWCGGLAGKPGDHILYAEASSIDGPWHAHGSTNPNTWDDVFDATYSTADFDGQDTCDPSVLQVNGTYYLYYGGLTIASSTTVPITTMIGVATSPDGLTWTRHSSQPIVVSAVITNHEYGAGQPSVLYKDGQFYLAYTDTTNPAGGGVYVLRSPDPFFVNQVEEYTATGFIPQVNPKVAHTPFRKGSLDVDWTYSDALDIFVMAVNGIPGHTVLYVYDGNLNGVSPVQWEYGTTMDGPGIVTDPQHHGLQGATCSDLLLDIMREVPDGSTDTAPYNGDLAHESATLHATNRSCQ